MSEMLMWILIGAGAVILALMAMLARSVTMYFLWTLAIGLILATTFTNFQYDDLNLWAGVLLVFAIINSLLMVFIKK